MSLTDQQPFAYRPIGGLNTVDSEDLLEDNEVRDCNNFLFENKQAVVRAKMKLKGALTGGIASAVVRATAFFIGGTYTVVIVTANNQVWTCAGLDPNLAVSQIAGPGATFGSIISAAGVNNALLVGGNTGGLVRSADLANYTVLAAAKYIYVAGHLSRAIAAYDVNAAYGYTKFAWSVAGDETDWASFGSGSAVISDMNDQITGLAVLHNIAVIFHSTGIHFATPTGVSNPAFRIDTWNRFSTGCAYPNTLAVDNNVAIFAALDNIYIFDMVRLTPIGDKIKNLLIPSIVSNYRGFITKTTHFYSDLPRARYHLVPINRSDLPWLIYDLTDGVWSKHSASTITVGDAFSLSSPASYPQFLDKTATAKLYSWADGEGCEDAAYLVGKTLVLGDLEKDYQVTRALLRNRDYGAAPDTTFTLSSKLNDTAQTSGALAIVGGSVNDQALRREWINLRQAGQDFVPRIDVPVNTRFAMNQISLLYEESGEFRGV